jgi:hypothetical protein
MSYSHARINLEKTNYSKLDNYQRILNPIPSEMNEIYYKYCKHHSFPSVMPIFDILYTNNDVIGYYDGDVLVAFSLIALYDEYNAEAIQFAWDYANPKLRLGFKSLENECAMYKELGYKYLYIGGGDAYKSKIDGIEIMSPVAWMEDRWTIDGFEKLPGK